MSESSSAGNDPEPADDTPWVEPPSATHDLPISDAHPVPLRRHCRKRSAAAASLSDERPENRRALVADSHQEPHDFEREALPIDLEALAAYEASILERAPSTPLASATSSSSAVAPAPVSVCLCLLVF